MQFDLPNARPVVFPIHSFDGKRISYGVRVRLDSERIEITAFRNGADAWAAGVDALADLAMRREKAR